MRESKLDDKSLGSTGAFSNWEGLGNSQIFRAENYDDNLKESIQNIFRMKASGVKRIL